MARGSYDWIIPQLSFARSRLTARRMWIASETRVGEKAFARGVEGWAGAEEFWRAGVAKEGSL